MFEVKLDGFDELAKNLRTLPARNSARVLREALTVGAKPIRAHAESIAPREPGAPDYADHMVITGGRGASVAVGPSNEPRSDEPQTSYAEQGLFLEFGTVDMDAQPHLGPAFDQTAEAALNPIGLAIWRGLVAEGFSTRGSGGEGGLL